MDKNDVFIIELDRPRELHCGHKALKMMERLLKKPLAKLGSMDDFSTGDIEKMLYCMLQRDATAHGEVLAISKSETPSAMGQGSLLMEDLLDAAPNYSAVIKAMGECLAAAFAGDEESEADEKN